MRLDEYVSVYDFYNSLGKQFPYFAEVVQKQADRFGEEWLRLFEEELKTFFSNDKKRIDEAIMGYGKFALDSMKLQVKFQKTREYDHKSYTEAASEVYQNKEYMFGLYLPGILLSHYLWKHHFLQHIFFRDKFLPLVKDGSRKTFYDIGTGTGFYSKELLIRTKLKGKGFDMSPHSLAHTMMMLSAYGVANRYETNILDIVLEPVPVTADYLINIEVLEHLEDPQAFLNALSKMLKKGGYGLISAAVNAPNADHIYLYRNADEVASHLRAAGFQIVYSTVDAAYVPRKEGDLVPINAAFIVTR